MQSPSTQEADNLVSIPFKREGVCKAQSTWDSELQISVVFQFPSNGKVYAKAERYTADTTESDVSIPFKREGVCKVIRF